MKRKQLYKLSLFAAMLIMLLGSCMQKDELVVDVSTLPVLQVQVALSAASNADVRTRAVDTFGSDAERTMSNYYIFIYDGDVPAAGATPLYAVKEELVSPVVFASDKVEVKTLTTVVDYLNLVSAPNKKITVAIVANVPTADISGKNGTYTDYLNNNDKYQTLTFGEFLQLYDDLEAVTRSTSAGNAKIVYAGIKTYDTGSGGFVTHTIPVELIRSMARIDITLESAISNVKADGMELLSLQVKNERRNAPFYTADADNDDANPAANEVWATQRNLGGLISFYTNPSQPSKITSSTPLELEFVVELTHNDGTQSQRSVSVELKQEGSALVLKRNYIYEIKVTFLDHNFTIEIMESGWNASGNNWDGAVDNDIVDPLKSLSLVISRHDGTGINNLINGKTFYSLSPAGNYSNILTASIEGGVPPFKVDWYYRSIEQTDFTLRKSSQYDSTTGNKIEESYEHFVFNHHDIRGTLYCEVTDGLGVKVKSDELDVFVKRLFYDNTYPTFQEDATTGYLSAEKIKITNGTSTNRVRYLRDSRDNKVYRVKLMADGNWWMIADLESDHYTGDNGNALIYKGTAATYPKEGGYLYTGRRAFNINGSIAPIAPVQGVCPQGWGIPTAAMIGPMLGGGEVTLSYNALGRISSATFAAGTDYTANSIGYNDANSTHFEFSDIQWASSPTIWPGNDRADTYGHYWLSARATNYWGTQRMWAYRVWKNNGLPSSADFDNSGDYETNSQFDGVRCVKVSN